MANQEVSKLPRHSTFLVRSLPFPSPLARAWHIALPVQTTGRMQATELKEKSRSTLEQIARWSYVAKAIFFASVAVFTYQLARGLGDKDPSRKQVLEEFMGNPLGQVLLGFIAVTLAAHTVWRLLEIVNDPYKKGTSPGGLLHRFTYLLSGISYATLVITTVKLLIGQGGGSDNGKQIWVAKALQWEGGTWLVTAFGAVFLLWGAMQAKKGITGGPCHSLECEHLAPWMRGAIRVCCTVGFLTYATLLGGVGWYLIRGAWAENPRWVRTTSDLLRSLESLPHGPLWMKLAAGGILLFSFFMLAMARYFPFKVSQDEE